ncbi:MAG: hypothetical protein WD273_07200 [Trueperaceae bacterium]
MNKIRRNGYAGLPALLVASAFSLPLVSKVVTWLGLPREMRIALPLLLGVVALAGVGQSRRSTSATSNELPADQVASATGAVADEMNATRRERLGRSGKESFPPDSPNGSSKAGGGTGS